MHRLQVTLVLVTLLAGTAMADSKDTDSARWYRYYNEKNQPTITDRITEDHISHGYDALDRGMQMLRHVPPQRILTADERAAAKAARAAEAQRKEDDKQLVRLYARPIDAEQNRDRQIDSIQLQIDFTLSALARLREIRTKEAQRAAALERTGRPVPKPLRESIANYDKQIQQLQSEIRIRKGEQEKVQQTFAPIIQRLIELTGIPATQSPEAKEPASKQGMTPLTDGRN
ncbi:MAG: hypothetical protein IT466_03955 [Moraxellaceae bacterium]|jgi:hypothetical protein|nr:hypothetical protein [Moraxellaceae bacterium]MBP7228892.1 hypothetical protein [Moraxellaceae bacterium]MBP8851477.1 hypothetical protein [Moraxellaceae bacterium]MBP9045229.1 hypothetical protein [Moraxellaceae bacterium]MBP9730316.1 hypothetical protein [Moraxellaceae bacterium]